jgi:hypothetical protein
LESNLILNKNIFRKTEVKIIRKGISFLFLFFLNFLILTLFFGTATGKITIEMLYVSIFISIVILKEFTEKYTPNYQKRKINIIISGLLVVFLLIVINEIIILISS